MARIVLLGATGFTGRLIAQRLAAGSTETVLAGRSARALAAMADELGGRCKTATVRLDDPATLTELLEPMDVLVTTVGSFIEHGGVAVSAAIETGAHYLDTTGEAPFIRRLFEDPAVAAARAAFVPAMGFNYATGNLAAALAIEGAGADEVDCVDIGYFLTGETQRQLSGGTVDSAAGVLMSPGFTRRNGELRVERCGARTRSWVVEGRRVSSMTLGSSEAITLSRSYPDLRTVDVYQGGLGALTPVVAQVSRLCAIPGAARIVNALKGFVVPGRRGGPDPEARARSGTHAIAVAYSRVGHILAEVVLRGPNVYDLTAELTAWGAQRAAEGSIEGSGPLGPVAAFGLRALEAAHTAAGVRAVELSNR
ncbi:saccharopine dehydrogenase [Mycobacterium lentiflavum]|uniref:Saccharopine dehydrogenase n=1 Tax=Mycobacterium lentiflavum TaxID=141349 RepID=A0A0E4H174_MYCLN|nr:saccharopine dehydrogenase NADP-binding domain-containing protein [Mycobacterium lentiflavum]CQD20155.1 saccharopine dehydrogenase [Mycobacterium lentiflavum]